MPTGYGWGQLALQMQRLGLDKAMHDAWGYALDAHDRETGRGPRRPAPESPPSPPPVVIPPNLGPDQLSALGDLRARGDLDATRVLALLVAGKQGNRDAQFHVGRTLIKGGLGIPQDARLGIAWLEAAAQQGIVAANCDLGKVFEQGIGVTMDSTRAIAHYEAAAKAGYPHAEKAIQNARNAIDLWQKAATAIVAEDYAKALPTLQALSSLQPENAMVWWSIGFATAHPTNATTSDEQTLRTALVAFHKAAELRPGSADTYARIGALLLRLGDDAGATAAAKLALSLDPQQAIASSMLDFMNAVEQATRRPQRRRKGHQAKTGEWREFRAIAAKLFTSIDRDLCAEPELLDEFERRTARMSAALGELIDAGYADALGAERTDAFYAAFLPKLDAHVLEKARNIKSGAPDTASFVRTIEEYVAHPNRMLRFPPDWVALQQRADLEDHVKKLLEQEVTRTHAVICAEAELRAMLRSHTNWPFNVMKVVTLLAYYPAFGRLVLSESSPVHVRGNGLFSAELGCALTASALAEKIEETKEDPASFNLHQSPVWLPRIMFATTLYTRATQATTELMKVIEKQAVPG